jgi:hypothetical protein
MTEAEIAQRFLARANPPPLLFRYRPPTKWVLEEICNQEIYAPKPNQLNDPFECSAPVWLNIDLMKQHWVDGYATKHGISRAEAEKNFEASLEWGKVRILDGLKSKIAQLGILCFSSNPKVIRMWSYYAKSHEGVCIGFDTKFRPFNLAMNVNYQNPDKPFDLFACLDTDPTESCNHIALRKAAEWKFEDEYRIPIKIEDNVHSIPYQVEAIREIRFGARLDANPEFKEELIKAISKLPHRPKLIQMGCDFDRFVLTETVI